MKKRTIVFYTPEEIAELTSIGNSAPTTRKKKLNQFSAKYNRTYGAAYAKLNELGYTTNIKKSTAAISTSEVRIPYTSIRVEGNEIVFSF